MHDGNYRCQILKISVREIPFIKNGYYKGYNNDVHDDFKIWKNKIYIAPPMLAAGDGPVMVYRKWAAQFHPKSWVEMKESELFSEKV